MKKILSFVLSGSLLFSNMAPVYAQAVSKPGTASSSVSDQFNPAELVASLNEIYAQFEAAAANETTPPEGGADSEEDNKAVLAQIGKAVFLLYETTGYKSQAEDFIFKFFPFIAPFLEEEERQKGVRVLHKFILACNKDAPEETWQRALNAAAILGLMGRFDKDSEEAIALVNFLKISEDTPLYPYVIQAVGQTLLAAAPNVLADAVMDDVKTSPSYGLVDGDYTLDVHSVMTKVLVGDGFSRGIERSYYPSDKGGRNFRNAWSDLGRFWAKEAAIDTTLKLKNELDRVLAWCIKNEHWVRFKPFVAGVLSTGYIYKNAGFSQAVAKNMFKMRKGDLDPYTATYMENLLAVGFHKLGGKDDRFNKLLTLQNKLTPEGKRALLSEYKCPSVSDFNEDVNLDELPRGSICQWRYASLDKINRESFQILRVDIIGHAIDTIGLVFGVAGLAKLAVSGVKNLKVIFRWIKIQRAAGKTSVQIVKMLGMGAVIKVTSAYHSVVSSVRNAYLGVRYNKLKSVVLSDLDTALANMSSGFADMRPFLSELKTQLAELSNEISPKELGQILERVFCSKVSDSKVSDSKTYLQKLLKHPAAIAEMETLLNNNPAAVGKQFLAILKNEQFWRSEDFKYFEIIDGTTLVPAVEVKRKEVVGDGVIPFSEWLMRRANVDAVSFRINNENILLENPFTANRAQFNELIVRIRQDESFGRVISLWHEGKNIKALTIDGTPFKSGDIIKQLNGGETKGGILALTAGESDPVVLLKNLYVHVRGQIPAAEASGLRIKVRLTSAELPEQLEKMHVHLEVYDPAKGFLRNEELLLYGTEEQRLSLLRFIKEHAPASPDVRFDVFELPVIKSQLRSIVEAPVPLEKEIPAAQYAEMYA